MTCLGLLGDRLDHMRMRMAERIHGNAGGEIEIAVAVGRGQPDALAPLKSEVDPRVGPATYANDDHDRSTRGPKSRPK